ncbi:hypothetical protein [Actinomadura sp. DC4]|uniref:hypothetical protein n=1 Tax=Actinomadura sp. DC4 TaxID=3055069 RepID=UPI0025B162C0|nr:hypothetical protein [Actinomadura sp. DC4]MDN3355359.1 hypothetical protein [Actinomadura sp. DC4]
MSSTRLAAVLMFDGIDTPADRSSIAYRRAPRGLGLSLRVRLTFTPCVATRTRSSLARAPGFTSPRAP